MPTETTGFYLGIKFQGSDKSYYFSCGSDDFALGDFVIVCTEQGTEIGVVSVLPRPLIDYDGSLALKSIMRRADARDMEDYRRGLEEAKEAMEIAKEEIANLKLAMDLTGAYYTLDGSKVVISYTSPEKYVDFRGLLKVLAPRLGCRIELRQIASRDHAKQVGGLGICGLPLCCSTFLNHFEGIGINLAKNQMLTLNVPKLSGPCGKLICCLAYEDEAYTLAKKEFPRLGTVVKLDDGPYTVDAFNILSRTVRLVNATRTDYQTFPLEDVKAMLNGTYVRKVEISKLEAAPLPSFGIELKEPVNEKQGNSQAKNQENNNKGRNFRQNNHGNFRHGNSEKGGNNQPRNNPSQQGGPKGNPQGSPQGNPQGQGHRNRHRHRHGRGGNRGGGEGAQ